MIRAYSHPNCARHHNPNSSVEAPQRLAAAFEGAERARTSGVDLDFAYSAPAPREALEAVHSPGYLDDLRALCEGGGGYLDGDTATNAHSWQAAVLGSGAAVSAVEGAMQGGVPSFAIVRPPGHHAGAHYAMGFCLLNHAAVAAARARSLGAERVALLDWDVHHGNGTQDIFYADERVLYLSVHQSPFYPGTGEAGEVGEGRGAGFTVNVPLPAASGEEVYAAAFAGVFVPVLREYHPELIVVSAGFDAHAADLLGGMALEADSFACFAALLASLARELGAAPLALVLEGGYNLEALAGSVAATVRGVGEEPPDWGYAGGVGPVERSRAALAPYWRGLG